MTVYKLMFPDILFFFISKISLSVTSSGLVLVKISCLLSHETIFCLTRISHVSSLSWDLWRTHETWDFLVRQEIFLWRPPHTRKSPVSCLMIESYVSRENFMSHHSGKYSHTSPDNHRGNKDHRRWISSTCIHKPHLASVTALMLETERKSNRERERE